MTMNAPPPVRLPVPPEPHGTSSKQPTGVRDALLSSGHVRLDGATCASILGPSFALEREAFLASWEGMPLDGHMADGGRYRRRRHAVLSARAGVDGLRRDADSPHWQSTQHNRLNGGIERWFEPIPRELTEGRAFQAVAALARNAFDAAEPGADWHVEAHQFRIEALPGVPGQPTPEGVHRDGVDWVLVMLAARHNIREGTTVIEAPDGTRLGRFTLTEPLDAVLLDDRRVLHGVTPVEPMDPIGAAHRDVLVLTFRRRDGAADETSQRSSAKE